MLLCLPQKFPKGRQSFNPVQNAQCVYNNLERFYIGYSLEALCLSLPYPFGYWTL